MSNVATNIIETIMDVRGWSDADIKQFREPKRTDLHNPFLLENMDSFISLLQSQRNQHIIIMPDYDADGILSGSLLAGGLSVFGFERVNVYAPRIDTGYGVTVESTKEAIDQFGVPDVVITTDNGSNAFDGIASLQQMGVKVLVTDHHNTTAIDPGDENVNPQRPTDNYPFKGLSGAAVIWKVMQAYALKYGTERDQRLIDQLIVLVGISVLSDVMPLVDENRYIVQESVNRLQDKQFLTFGSEVPGVYGSIFKGLLALHNVCDIHGKFNYGFDESTFGFIYGPMLNSPRRMTGSSIAGFQLFLSQTYNEAYAHAEALFGTNEERKAIMRKYGAHYLSDAYQTNVESRINYMVGVVPYKHGLIGLLAGQFTSKFDLPSIVFSAPTVSDVRFDSIEGENIQVLTGSARSPMWFDLHGALSEIQRKQPAIFQSFGGHKQAAGLAINAKYYDDFRRLFIQSVDTRVSQIKASGEGISDGTIVDIPWDEYESADVQELDGVITFIESIKPFGQAFREPDFKVSFNLGDVDVFYMGADKQHVKLTLPNDLVIIQWNGAEQLRLEVGHMGEMPDIEAIGTLSANEFRGSKTMQIIADKLAIN